MTAVAYGYRGGFVASEFRQDRGTGKGPVQEPGGRKRRAKWARKYENP